MVQIQGPPDDFCLHLSHVNELVDVKRVRDDALFHDFRDKGPVVVIFAEASAACIAAVVIVFLSKPSESPNFIQNLLLRHSLLWQGENDLAFSLVRELFSAVVSHFVKLLVDLRFDKRYNLQCSEYLCLDSSKAQFR